MSLLWSVQPKAPHTITAGIVYQHKRLIRADGNAVREIQIAQQHARLPGPRIVSHEAAVGLMLEHIVLEPGQRILIRSVREVDRAVGRYIEIVGAAKGQPFGVSSQNRNTSVTGDR